MKAFLKCLFWRNMYSLQHNNHYIKIYVFGKEIKACARCLGMYSGMLMALPIMMLLAATERFEFWYIFSLSWLLASFAIVDWGTVKGKIWQGNNYLRLFTGFMLGIAGMMYLFLLPINPAYRFLSLFGFAIIFDVIHYGVLCKEHHLSLRNPIPQNLAIIGIALPLTIGQTGGCAMTGGCGECCTCCPCGNCGACMCCPLCCCIGVIPIICLMKSGMDKAGGEHAK